jgi:hypothetical protein
MSFLCFVVIQVVFWSTSLLLVLCIFDSAGKPDSLVPMAQGTRGGKAMTSAWGSSSASNDRIIEQNETIISTAMEVECAQRGDVNANLFVDGRKMASIKVSFNSSKSSTKCNGCQVLPFL